jgi:hypothetical protein
LSTVATECRYADESCALLLGVCVVLLYVGAPLYVCVLLCVYALLCVCVSLYVVCVLFSPFCVTLCVGCDGGGWRRRLCAVVYVGRPIVCATPTGDDDAPDSRRVHESSATCLLTLAATNNGGLWQLSAHCEKNPIVNDKNH